VCQRPDTCTDCWNAELYAANSAHHRAQDEAFLASFSLQPSDIVLDLGSGTGEFTNKLAACVPEGSVLGVDGSLSQVEFACRSEADNVDHELGRLEDLDAVLGDCRFDAVVSRATLHWVARGDHPALLRSIRSHLRPGGLLRVEFAGHGQMASLIALLDDIATSLAGKTAQIYAPTVEEYRTQLLEAGFELSRGFVRYAFQKRSVPSYDALVGLMRSQPYVAYEPYLPMGQRQKFREIAEQRAFNELRRGDGTYDQDFVRMDVLAFAP
jgi:trans-aconitate 2-methyltransferase